MSSFNKFTIKAQEALERAQEYVARYQHGELKALHLLRALIDDEHTLVRPMLLKANVDVVELERELDRRLKELPKVFAVDSESGTRGRQLYLSQELMKALNYAAESSVKQKDEFVSCEHLLLALVDLSSGTQDILKKAGAKRETLIKVLSQLRGSHRVTDEMPESKFQVLEKYPL